MASEENIISSQNDDLEEEIDFIKLIKTFWEGRKSILITMLFFGVVGLFIAIFTEKEYSASTVFVPQGVSGKSSGGFGGLAALAGINVGNGAGETGIGTTLYPVITYSAPFLKELINTKLTIKGQDEKITYQEYYSDIYSPGLLSKVKKYTIGLPRVIIGLFGGKGKTKKNESSILANKNEGIVSLTPKERGLINRLKSQFSIDIDQKDNDITIGVKMHEAIASAEMVYQVEQLLEKYIIDFKVKKSANKLKFISERYAEKEKIFKSKQQQLANFQDRNQFVVSSRAQTRLSILQSEYDLAYNVYSGLANQIETQQIQVKENTPIFTIIKPVTIPVTPISSSKTSALLMWSIFGFIVGISRIFVKEFIKNFKRKLA